MLEKYQKDKQRLEWMLEEIINSLKAGSTVGDIADDLLEAAGKLAGLSKTEEYLLEDGLLKIA